MVAATQTDQDGAFAFAAVPLGDYIVTANASGFNPLEKSFTLASDTSSILHLQLAVASVSEKVVVSASPEAASLDSVTPTTLIDRADIAQTRGRFHQQRRDDYRLHARCVLDARHAAHARRPPNHLAHRRRADPEHEYRDKSGSSGRSPRMSTTSKSCAAVYDAQYGDRTYGEFNVLPRSGFERSNDGELAPPSEAITRRTTKSILEATRNDSPTMPV